jgi:hypothetical protein
MQFSSFISYEELTDWVEQFVTNNEEISQLEIIGQSNEGRDIRIVHVTNKALPINDKEIALIIIGRHGNELGTRVVGPTLLEWLTSKDARGILDRQHIIVVPVANPDGCAHSVFGLPVYHLSGLEKRSLLPLAAKYVPDVVMDVHSVGKETSSGLNWGGLEAIIIDHTAHAGEDQYILRDMTREIINTAAKKGYPFLFHTLEPYQDLRKKADALSEYAFNNHVNEALYSSFHSLTFGMEVNHFILDPNDTAESGLAVIRPLLEMGNRVFPWEFYPGYPNKILSGDFLASVRPRGTNAQERRNSRKEIWSKRDFFKVPFNPYREMLDDRSVRITVKYSGDDEITSGIAISFRIRGTPKIKRVTINDERVDYYKKNDDCSTHVFVDLETIKNNDTREIVAEF